MSKWTNCSFFLWITHSLLHSQKTSDWLKKLTKIVFLLYIFWKFFKKTSHSLISSFLMSNVCKSLRSLTKNEQPWAIRSGHLPKISEWAITSFFEQIDHLLIFSHKMSDWLRKPMSKIPTLTFSYTFLYVVSVTQGRCEIQSVIGKHKTFRMVFWHTFNIFRSLQNSN